MKSKFTHLHLHTEYSLLDGSARINDVISRTKELGMDAVAITDHGVMFGVIEFYKAAKQNGIKPIIGCEVYIASGSRFNKENSSDNFYYHLVLLAENNTGVSNLYKLVSAGYTEGFYHKPRIDLELLREFKDGLIALSACTSGPVSRNILRFGYNEGLKQAVAYKEIFGANNFFIEIMDHGLKEEKTVTPILLQIAKETGLSVVCTNDCHYVRQADSKAHEILLCIQTGKTINDEDRMTFESDELYIKSEAEMLFMFSENTEAIYNTHTVAERCNVEIKFGEYRLPKYNTGTLLGTSAYLRKLCEEGALEKYGIITDAIKSRMEFELNTIKTMGFEDYFLVVWDFIHYARKNGIIVGPGRGSAAGSIVSYCLSITNIDPLKYDLLFERFLNPNRISMPDIDIDFCYERRSEVINYVSQKYGADHVAQIITFGTLAARACIRDVGRVLAMPYGDVDKIAKMIPFATGMTIEKALDNNPELKSAYNKDTSLKYLLDMSVKLEGLPRHASTHAAGVVICSEPVTEYVPLYVNDNVTTTQFPMNTLEELGLVKIDFLGLRTLTVINNACELVLASRGITIDINTIDYDDKNVYSLIASGRTEGVFQLESAGMKAFMKELKPECITDVIAGIALYRPGPMDFIPKYIEGKKDSSRIKYIHPSLEPILKETYGCIVYQEQVMRIVRELAGYSLARSDLVRRAMSKKKTDVMERERNNFIYGQEENDTGAENIQGCLKNGIPAEVAIKIFDEMTDFAKYAFNKSHAAAYAVIGYQTAWLKNYYKPEFMAALMTSVMDSSGKISEYIADCKKMGIYVNKPDINTGEVRFGVRNGSISYGLSAIKNVGAGLITTIVRERAGNGNYKSLTDFIRRIEGRELNKRAVESLIKAGAFDSLGGNRRQYLAEYENIIKGAAAGRNRTIEGQLSLMDSFGDNLPPLEEFGKTALLNYEYEVLGVYLSGHPLDDYSEILSGLTTVTSLDMVTAEAENATPQVNDGQYVTAGGMIAAKNIKYTKSNKTMAFITLMDLYGQMEVVVFPKVYEKAITMLKEGAVVIVKGRVSLKEDEDAKLLCDEIIPYETLRGLKTDKKRLWLKICEDKEHEIETAMKLLKNNPGKTPVIVYHEKTGERRLLDKSCFVDEHNEEYITKALTDVLGDGTVKMA